jgi:hypothetical protein
MYGNCWLLNMYEYMCMCGNREVDNDSMRVCAMDSDVQASGFRLQGWAYFGDRRSFDFCNNDYTHEKTKELGVVKKQTHARASRMNTVLQTIHSVERQPVLCGSQHDA